jgi:superfamily II DNA or RNA helicase
VIVDEAHMAMSPIHMASLLKFRRQKFLAFTATPDGKSDGRDSFLEAIFGPQIIHVPYDEAVAAGNVVQLHVKFLRCHQGPDVSQYEDFTKKNKLGIWRNSFRNQLIADEVRLQQKENPDAQILIMVDKTEHAFVLGKLLPEFEIAHGPIDKAKIKKLADSGALDPLTQKICDKKSIVKLQAAFAKSEIKYCIATGVWSRGVNFPDLNILVRADGQASPINAAQIPGRLSRLGTDKDKAYGLLIDIVDTFSRDLLGRSLKRAAVCRKNKWDIDKESINILRSAGRLYRQKCTNPDSLPDEFVFDTEVDG